MEAIVRKHLRRQLNDGTVEALKPGDRITADWSGTLERLVEKGFIEIPMTEGRRKSLEMCMDATMFMTMKEVQEIGRWVTTMEVMEIEEEVHRTYMDVMKGLKKLEDYRKAVGRWKEAGTNPVSDQFRIPSCSGSF